MITFNVAIKTSKKQSQKQYYHKLYVPSTNYSGFVPFAYMIISPVA